MESLECAAQFGPATAAACRRLAEMGWDPAMGAGWFSALAAVVAGFVFSSLADYSSGLGRRSICSTRTPSSMAPVASPSMA